MPAAQIPTAISVDFSNVEERREGGKAAHVPEGDYLLKIVGCEKKHKKDEETGPGYLNWKLQVHTPAQFATAGFVWHITSLKDEALWNLRNFLDDLGIKVPKSKVNVPIAQIVSRGMIIGATLGDDEYNNKVKSKIVATFKKSEYEGETSSEDDDDDEVEEEVAPTPKKKKAAAAPVETKAAATDDDEDEDLEELDVDDL